MSAQLATAELIAASTISRNSSVLRLSLSKPSRSPSSICSAAERSSLSGICLTKFFNASAASSTLPGIKSSSSSSAAAGGPDFAAKPMTVLDSIKFDEEVQKKQQLAKEQNRQRALRKVGTPSPRTQPPGKTPGAPGTPGNCTPRAEQRRASRRKSNFADPLKTITAVQKPWYIRMHVNIGDEVMHSLHGRGKVVLIDVSDQRVHVQFGDQDGGKHRYTEESWKSKLRPADVVDARGSDAFVALDTCVRTAAAPRPAAACVSARAIAHTTPRRPARPPTRAHVPCSGS